MVERGDPARAIGLLNIEPSMFESTIEADVLTAEPRALVPPLAGPNTEARELDNGACTLLEVAVGSDNPLTTRIPPDLNEESMQVARVNSTSQRLLSVSRFSMRRLVESKPRPKRGLLALTRIQMKHNSI